MVPRTGRSCATALPSSNGSQSGDSGSAVIRWMTSSRGLVHSIEGFSARTESQRAGILSQGSRLICAERTLRRGTFVAYLAISISEDRDASIAGSSSISGVGSAQAQYLSTIEATLVRSGKSLLVDEEALDAIVRRGHSAAHGARLLKRAIDEHIKLTISTRAGTRRRCSM